MDASHTVLGSRKVRTPLLGAAMLCLWRSAMVESIMSVLHWLASTPSSRPSKSAPNSPDLGVANFCLMTGEQVWRIPTAVQFQATRRSWGASCAAA